MTRKQRHLYWNANGYGVAILAIEGAHRDYAAYIGATEGLTTTEEETVEFVHERGCKIPQEMAESLFPSFKEAGLTWRQ